MLLFWSEQHKGNALLWARTRSELVKQVPFGLIYLITCVSTSACSCIKVHLYQGLLAQILTITTASTDPHSMCVVIQFRVEDCKLQRDFTCMALWPDISASSARQCMRHVTTQRGIQSLLIFKQTRYSRRKGSRRLSKRRTARVQLKIGGQNQQDCPRITDEWTRNNSYHVLGCGTLNHRARLWPWIMWWTL